MQGHGCQFGRGHFFPVRYASLRSIQPECGHYFAHNSPSVAKGIRTIVEGEQGASCLLL